MYELDQQKQAIDTEKTEYDIRSDYQEIPMMPNAPLFPILQGGEIGSEKNKDFNGVLNPFGEDKFYAPKAASTKENWEIVTRKEGNKDMKYWVNKNNPFGEPIPFGENFHAPPSVTNVKIDMPKPEKWKEFGNLITSAKETQFTDSDGKVQDKSEQEINQAWNKAKNNFYSNMNPNAYAFYKSRFKDVGKENIDNATYLQTIKEGLANDQLTADDAQDLIDASAYRSDLFGAK